MNHSIVGSYEKEGEEKRKEQVGSRLFLFLGAGPGQRTGIRPLMGKGGRDERIVP